MKEEVDVPPEKVVVISDWDADGTVSAAIIVYTQEVMGRFPLKGKSRVKLVPSSPRTIGDSMAGLECADVLVILDIPYTNDVEKALERFASRCPGPKTRIYYFDHHESTIEKLPELEERFKAFAVVGRSPTSILLKNFLERLGVGFPPRLGEFIKAVGVLEKSPHAEANKRIVEYAASISKIFNKTRDPGLWKSYVRWISNPIPFEKPPLTGEKRDPIIASKEASKELDKEAQDIALSLVFKAKNLGYIKFIDARGVKTKGSIMGIVSAIYKMLRFPIAVLVSKSSGETLLVIRTPDKRAKRIAETLLKEGVLHDIGGHESLIVARVKENIETAKIEELLRKASLGSGQDPA